MLLNSVRARTVVALCLGALVTAACGDDGDDTAKASKTVVIGSASFSENIIVANMYAGALQNEGYQVVVRKGLGQREIYLPALEKGGKDNGIDLVPEYVGTLLEFVNKNAGVTEFTIDVAVPNHAEVVIPRRTVQLGSLESFRLPIFVSVNEADFRHPFEVEVAVTDGASARHKEVEARFLGPINPRKQP